MLTFYYAKLLIQLHNVKKKYLGQFIFTRAAEREKKRRTRKNLLKRILRLCLDAQWKAELVIQEADCLLQCVLEN